MHYTFADFFGDAARFMRAPVVRILLMLAAFKTLALLGLPDQSQNLADAIANALEFLFLAAAARLHAHSLDIGPAAARARKAQAPAC